MIENLDYLEKTIKGVTSHYNLLFVRSIHAWFSGKEINIYYTIERDTTEEQIEELRCVSTEVISNFYDNTLSEKFENYPPSSSNDMAVITLPATPE